MKYCREKHTLVSGTYPSIIGVRQVNCPDLGKITEDYPICDPMTCSPEFTTQCHGLYFILRFHLVIPILIGIPIFKTKISRMSQFGMCWAKITQNSVKNYSGGLHKHKTIAHTSFLYGNCSKANATN